MLGVIETHPIQYHAPVYRLLQAKFGIPVTVFYGSDFSLTGYRDREFGETFAWDTDLLSGYTSVFLSRVANGGGRVAEEVSTHGLGKALQEVKPGAVLLVGYSPRFHQVALYQAWKEGCPILFRGETTDSASRRNPVKAWIRDHVLRWIYRLCARLLYVGQCSYRHFRRLGCPEEKLVRSPYCVDTSPFQCNEAARAHLRSTVRQRLGVTEAQTVLLFSGKLSPRKGPDLLLRAIKELPPEMREYIVLVFLGSGKLREALDDLAQSPPLLKVHFLGFQNQTRLSQFYHAADLLVLPSLHAETWGLVVNEALHHGLPCVVSEAVGCAPDLVEPGVTGEIAATGSVASLASAIARALALIGRPEVRETCREKVSGYTVEMAAEGIAMAYWAVAGQARHIAHRV
jgi:glycosyltransferase involved in cell wall biosynthesis